MPLPRPLRLLNSRVTDDPIATLWHYVCGHMVDWADHPGGRLRWTGVTHRGVQWLDKVQFPRKQRRYIFSPLFDIKYNQAFDETIRGCADQTRNEPTWISDAYIRALLALHSMGYAHSFEAWSEGKLVGGAYGVQLGSLMTCDSMFHRISNASKAAYGQTLLHLQKRGFKIVDTNGVAAHQVNYGEEWMPQWQFERLVFDCLKDSPAITDDRPAPPPLPFDLRAMIPLLRLRRAVARRLVRAVTTSVGRQTD
jgi:leucyl/phenylalanyl-tRNA--protein transferase